MTDFTCPYCRKQFTTRERGIWPFCSERCKAADLGRWASEDYRIAAVATEDDDGADTQLDEGEDN